MSLLIALLLAGSAAGAPCAITGESIDIDAAGLRVRASPSLDAPVVGRLLPGMDPHVFFHEDKPTLAEGLVGANFTVDRVSGDWLHIRDIDPVTDGIAPDGSLELTPNYAGEGWVHASLVRLLPTNSNDLRTSPDGSRAHPARFAGLDARIVQCSGRWAGLRLDDGSTGWLPSRPNPDHAAKVRAALGQEAPAR